MWFTRMKLSLFPISQNEILVRLTTASPTDSLGAGVSLMAICSAFLMERMISDGMGSRLGRERNETVSSESTMALDREGAS